MPGKRMADYHEHHGRCRGRQGPARPIMASRFTDRSYYVTLLIQRPTYTRSSCFDYPVNGLRKTSVEQILVPPPFVNENVSDTRSIVLTSCLALNVGASPARAFHFRDIVPRTVRQGSAGDSTWIWLPRQPSVSGLAQKTLREILFAH